MNIRIETRIQTQIGDLKTDLDLVTDFEFRIEDCIDMTVSEIMNDQLKKHIEYHKAHQYSIAKGLQCVD